MKIAVISDTHGNLANIQTALEEIKQEEIESIIHCGDIGGLETLEFLDKFNGKVFAVFGNADKGYFEKENSFFERFSNIKFFGSTDSAGADSGEIELGGKKIAFVHFPEIAQGLAKSQQYDLVFHGHTHRPHQEKIGKTELINPGNLAGLFYRPSFAVYDTQTDKLESKILQ